MSCKCESLEQDNKKYKRLLRKCIEIEKKYKEEIFLRDLLDEVQSNTIKMLRKKIRELENH